MTAVGTALGPSLGGLLISAFGWPSIFLVAVPFGIAAFGLLRHFLPADRKATTPARFDLIGAVLLAASLAAYALAVLFCHLFWRQLHVGGQSNHVGGAHNNAAPAFAAVAAHAAVEN